MFQKGLSKSTGKNLELLAKLPITSQFYLAGGTACALHFGHRLSFDLDFFTKDSFNAKELARKISNLEKFEVEEILKDTLLGKLNNEKVSFFYYQYPLLKPAEVWRGINIASTQDLAAMKIEAISGRGRKRDFIDLFFICKEIPVKKVLNLYEQKYQALSNNLRHILRSLMYFSDAEEDEMPKMIKKVSWDQVKSFFTLEIKKITRELIS